MTAKSAKIKDYIKKGVRRIKHRRGFGVHSPFAYRIIDEVIEEKIPYYAYQPMQKVYHKQAPISAKVAFLMFRLANRFQCRNILEVGCDGGYTLLPLAVVDSRNKLYSVSTAEEERLTLQRLSYFRGTKERVSFVNTVAQLPSDYVADMIVINAIPQEMHVSDFVAWIMSHISEQGVMIVKGIQPGRQHEEFWDILADRDDVEVTMDLYDFGLAIRRPRFFKQHYIVSF